MIKTSYNNTFVVYFVKKLDIKTKDSNKNKINKMKQKNISL